MMAHEERRTSLDSEKTNKIFEELIESKMDKKITRDEVIKDIYNSN